MNNLKFEELGLSPEILKAVKEMGFEETSPIQSVSIPVLLKGQDAIGQAQTGTGKTAAFGIPIISKIDTSKKELQAIVLCPTRELAIQVSEEFQRLAKYKTQINILPIYGGQPIEHQIRSLRNKPVHIIIGTPGRVLDHISRKTIYLSKVNMLTLDEADEMLDMGFREDIEKILKYIPTTAQKIFFSATMAKEILDLTKKYLKDPKSIKIEHKALTVPKIEQYYIEVAPRGKFETLCRLLDFYHPKLSLVFCNTKRMVDELVDHLIKRGYFADGLHGDMRQNARNRVIEKFRKGEIEILVATDVAGRGLDIENVECVFNYDIPYDEEDYVHRIGRTGRAGRSGKAFSFVIGRDIRQIKRIQHYTKAPIKLITLPTAVDIEETRINNLLDKVKKVISAGNLRKYETIIEKLLTENITSLDIASALFKMKFEENNKKRISKS